MRKGKEDGSNSSDLIDKLSAVDSFMDIGNFSDKDYFELLRCYHPAFAKTEFPKDNDDPIKCPVTYAKRYQQLINAIVDDSSNSPVEQTFAKQIIRAIALSQHNAQRANRAEDLLERIKEFAPGKKAMHMVLFKEYDELVDRLEKGEKNLSDEISSTNKNRWLNWDRNFNWYASHTLQELANAIQVDKKTIRTSISKPKSRTTTVKAANTFYYSSDECLKVLKWLLGVYLPKRNRGDFEFSIHTGKIILLSLDNHELLDTDKEKVRNAILESCGPEVEFQYISPHIFGPNR